MIVRWLACSGVIFATACLGGMAEPVRAEPDVDGIEELLPRHETSAELEVRRLRRAGPSASVRLADPPPVAPVRNCAEWEPAVGVLIRYPLGLPYGLLRDLDDANTIFVVVSSSQLAAARANLPANGVDTTHVRWLVRPNDSIYTRDYGPWFVFDGNGDVTIIDHVYNRPARPNDDLIPVEFGNAFGYPVIRHDLWHAGGNYMTDGAGVSMSTDLIYDEAAIEIGMTPAEVDQLMRDYYGIEPYHVVDDVAAGGIHHIDPWAKFLDEETVLVQRVWTSHPSHAALEQRATLIASLTASTGGPYGVHRVDCHNIGGNQPAPYTNSLILNRRIYVPTFGNSTYDTAALDAYRAAAPGYDVRGYTHSWVSDDALHCRTIGIMDPAMLRVSHVPIRDEMPGPVQVTAFVDDRSESGITSVRLNWRFAGGPWNVVAMAPTGSDLYAAKIPQPPRDTLAEYFIHATDASGRSAGMPRVEPDGWYSFPIKRPTTGVPRVPGVEAGMPFPNPSSAGSTFEFRLKYPERVDLTVYDVGGRLVRRLLAVLMPEGLHRIVWDGRDTQGVQVRAGTYYFRLRAAGIAYSRPVSLVR